METAEVRDHACTVQTTRGVFIALALVLDVTRVRHYVRLFSVTTMSAVPVAVH